MLGRSSVYSYTYNPLILIIPFSEMNSYRPSEPGKNSDFRYQYKSVEEYKAAINRMPKIPSLGARRDSKPGRGLNRAPTYSRYRTESQNRPRSSQPHRNQNQFPYYNHGKVVLFRNLSI